MTPTALTLRHPHLAEEPEFLRAYEATRTEPIFYLCYEEGMSLAQYLERLHQYVRGENLPDGHVPSTFLMAFVGERIVGRISIRHELNDFLLREGGHIGYAVVPEFRLRGYATEILRQGLEIARQRLGIARVLVTCDDDNIGSRKVIERNGGMLENVLQTPEMATPKRRYWFHAPLL